MKEEWRRKGREQGIMPQISITVLVDNSTLIDRYLLAEPGLSVYLETGELKILFDCGYSDLFISNAHRLGINLLDLDYVVLSHGHLDHTWGIADLIRYLTQARIENKVHRIPVVVSHPFTFYPRSKPPHGNIGSMFSEDRLSYHLPVRAARSPLWLSEDLVYLGEIERNLDFKSADQGKRKIVMPDGREEPDYLLDDSALACRTGKGLVIITGCSHSGICNIISQAQKICGEERILDIIGGLHLLSPPARQMAGTLEFLSSTGPGALHACHCTSLQSKIALSSAVPIHETGVGLRITY
jgi:7,8-dihydropterin-6-yl-methyl-4-(beta-D-ribofuranosyl)aminobenzene 5'-phosphate synthase